MQANSLDNYYKAQECYRIGDYKEGLKYALAQLERDLEFYGRHSVEVARDYNSVGIFYSKLKEYKKAIDYLEGALETREALLGKNSYDTNLTRQNVEYLKSIYQKEPSLV